MGETLVYNLYLFWGDELLTNMLSGPSDMINMRAFSASTVEVLLEVFFSCRKDSLLHSRLAR